MDGQAIQQRLKAIKDQIAAIHDLEAQYKLWSRHSPIAKSAHEARRAALESIKAELASLLPRKVQ